MEVEEHDNRVSGLMMDDLGKETVSPLQLPLLNQISKEQLPCSAAPFVEIPSEVLGEFVQYLGPTSLASFALVNKDCLQLARSRQFASVSFDKTDCSFALISKLLCEFSERSRSPTHTTSRPCIGDCIQHITVATDTRRLSARNDFNFAGGIETERMSRKRTADACRNVFYQRRDLNALGTILSFREVLPCLESLDFEGCVYRYNDPWVVPRRFFEGLPYSSIKHLRLNGVKIDEEFRVEMADTRGSDGHWPLQVLHMSVIWYGSNGDGSVGGSTSSLCSSLLQLCAQTLTSLTWQNVNGNPLTADFQTQLKFPNLRELRLEFVIFSDSKYLEALMGANLVLLVADIMLTDIHLQFFQKRGKILSLETFVWTSIGDCSLMPDKNLDFLRANPQLSKFSLPYSSPPKFLEKRLLPLLSSSFKNLGSLSLVWEALEIPTSALEIISTLQSLEQIHLSCGQQRDWKHNWMIDHDLMRRYLCLLPHLKKVAFSRDTYCDCLGYYVLKPNRYQRQGHPPGYPLVLLDGEDVDNSESDPIKVLGAIAQRTHVGRSNQICSQIASVGMVVSRATTYGCEDISHTCGSEFGN